MTETRRPETAQASTGLWKKAGIALLLLAAFGTAYYFGYRKSAHKYDAFARCLTDRQVKMYGAYWCPHCAEQKEMFGESFALAPYVECGVAGDRRAEQQVCKDAGIQHLSLIHISEPTRQAEISYAVFCLKK